MAVTPTSLKARFPALAGYDDDRLTLVIAEGALELDEDEWGTLYETGLTYIAAHLAVTTTSPGGESAAGPVASRSVGSVSVSYAVAADSSAVSLNDSAYGKRFAELRRRVLGGPVAIQ